MPFDPRTEYLNLPLPHEKNDLSEDLPRLVEQARGFDAHAQRADAAQENIVKALSTKANASDMAAVKNAIDALDAVADAAQTAADTAQISANNAAAQATANEGKITAHAALLATTDSAGHARADGTTISAAADGTLSVLSAPLWQGRALHVSSNAPADADGAEGDLWLKIAG